MKNTSSSETTPSKTGLLQVSGFNAGQGRVRQQATSIVLKTTIDLKRQHSAIGELVKMCRASSVVTVASQGITAEVRRDRDRGHE
jgi:hypothetical protein